MSEQTTINDAQIRAEAAEIEIIAKQIQSLAGNLRNSFNALHPNLQFAHPTKDVALDRFMLTLARVKMLCDALPALEFQARAMREFHMPRPEESAAQYQPVPVGFPALAPA